MTHRQSGGQASLVFAIFALVTALTATSSAAVGRIGHSASHRLDACDLIPQNNLRFPDNGRTTAGGMNRTRFNQLIKATVDVYQPIFRSKGTQLIVRGLWDNADVNAVAYPGRDPIEFADRGDGAVDMRYRRVDMYGGMARYPLMTVDGFLMVLCHEIGHHIGGLPVKAHSWNPSNEGQSDYFAASKCFRRVLEKSDNISVVNRMRVDSTVRNKCFAAHNRDMKETALCIRSAMAGITLAQTLADLGGDGRVDVRTPDRSVAPQTDDTHPAAQCRLDTYLAGALCRVSALSDMTLESPLTGACVPERATNSAGIRPACWFNPIFYGRPELLTRF